MGKRMFSTDIIESDAFLDMPLTAQSLYMHLNMNADNDGFVNPKRVMRMCGAASDDLQILIAKRFIIAFDSGVCVIKHWWINNTKRQDRHVATSYQNEFEELGVNPNKSYTKLTTQLALDTESVIIPATMWQPSGNHWVPQSNAIQSNSVQTNTNQPSADKPRDFKKNYRKAADADRAQEARVAGAASRKGNGYESFSSVGEALKQKKIPKQ